MTGASSVPPVGTAASGTIDVGMGPVATGDPTLSGASGTGAASGTAASSEGMFGGMFDKRQDGAATKGAGTGVAGGSASSPASTGAAGATGLLGAAGNGSSASVSGGGATVTKGDQCCFTTHIPASGASATGAPGLPGGQPGAGTASHPYNAMSGSPNASITGAANGTGNETGNGTGLDSGDARRVDERGSVGGMGSIALVLVLGVAGGGWTLL